MKRKASILGMILIVLCVVGTARTATYNIADGDVAGLIAAINASNASPGPDTINLAQNGVYTLTYVAGPDSWHGNSGLPIIQGPSQAQPATLTINGNGATIQRSQAPGTPDFRVLYALYSYLTIDNLIIKGGRGFGPNRCGGGGLYLNVTTTIIRNSTITENFADEGGGICNNNASRLTIENSTISYNTAFGARTGGGILNFDALQLSINNSTIYENQAGGALGFEGRGDAVADAFSPVGSISIKNSILASPTRGSGVECAWFTPVGGGHNIFGDSSCGQNVLGGDQIVSNLQLGPLMNNGGPTPTHALLAGNPAIDAIPIAECLRYGGSQLLTDQRGFARRTDAGCDIGAFEYQHDGSQVRTFSVASQTGSPGDVVTVPVYLQALGTEKATGFSLSFDPTKLSISDISGFGNPDISRGPGIDPGAFLGVNATQAANGRVGILVDSNTPIPAGTQHILNFQFHILPGAAGGVTPITFGNVPVAPSISDPLGNLLQAIYAGGSITIAEAACSAMSSTLTVPGRANPWLAGMPSGSTDAGWDLAPAESPIQVIGIPISGVLTFNSNGITTNCPGCVSSSNPDGSFPATGHFWGSVNGIGNIVAPLNSMIGVFINDNAPSTTPAPSGFLEFRTPESIDFLSLSPALKQPFFIGNGRTSSGVIQQFVVPQGATRLLLGSMDGYEWSNNGGSFSVQVSSVCVDNTPPTIMPTVSGTQGSNGWYTGDVEVSWDVTDGESSITSSTGCSATTVAADTNGVTFTCSATSGGGTATESVTVKRDATAPAISCGSPDGVWHPADVSIACTGVDPVSGLAAAGDASFSLSTSVTSGTETSNASTGSRSVCDNAGNCATAGPIAGNKVDKKAPEISITSPTGGTYLLNQAVAANYTCSDGGSGVANCTGTAANGSQIDTALPGSKVFSVSATDNVGNTATPATVSYSVAFGVVALYDQTRAHKSGSTIPIKIRLVDANGANVSSPALLPHAISVIQVSSQASTEFGDAGNSNPDFDFRYDAALGGYIFNLQTTGMGTGSYLLNFIAGSPTPVYSVGFQIRR